IGKSSLTTVRQLPTSKNTSTFSFSMDYSEKREVYHLFKNF
ncbi:threonyl and Alanyl tRNA synthetase second additional domain protein, partial [Chlamydia psittaci 84-8471/1]